MRVYHLIQRGQVYLYIISMKRLEVFKSNQEWEIIDFTDTVNLTCTDIDLSNRGTAIILKICGSKHILYWNGADNITIGCVTYTVDYWLTNWYEVAISHGYTADQANEYKHYIDLVAVLNEK